MSGSPSPDRSPRKLFGASYSRLDPAGCARLLTEDRRTPEQGVGLFVTPNIQHIAEARRDPDFAAAVRDADLVVADGFPVYRYARLVGVDLPGRVTGREVAACILARPDLLAAHRLFFVLDSVETVAALDRWRRAHAPDLVYETQVPPFGFDRDPTYQHDLAAAIRRFGTTLLFLCVGAPRSELFVHRHRGELPACWALAVGQAVRLVVGDVPPPPRLAETLNLEWLWRIWLEPRRMLRRYGPAAAGFLAAIATDLRTRGEGR